MKQYSPADLHAIALNYSRGQADIDGECRSAVTTWRFADARMIDPNPLSTEVDRFFEYMRGWDIATPGRWLANEHEVEYPYGHGFDRQGRLRVLTRGTSTNYLLYSADYIDEVPFINESIAWIKRFVLRRPAAHVAAMYEFRQFPNETSCTEEVFEWAADRIASSKFRTWIWEEGSPVESEFRETYKYFHNREGRLMRAVRTMTRDGKPWTTRSVFARHPLRRLADRAVDFLRKWTIEIRR
jgi:hypothetical protein